MEDQLISLKTAKLAKEIGFNIECNFFYNRGSNYKLQYDSIIRTGDDIFYEASTQSLLQKYLREIHNIFVTVNPIYYFKGGNIGYAAEVNSLSSKNQGEILLDGFTIYSSYEEALEQGLYEALLLIKN